MFNFNLGLMGAKKCFAGFSWPLMLVLVLLVMFWLLLELLLRQLALPVAGTATHGPLTDIVVMGTVSITGISPELFNVGFDVIDLPLSITSVGGAGGGGGGGVRVVVGTKVVSVCAVERFCKSGDTELTG